jgi:hypothetical protein
MRPPLSDISVDCWERESRFSIASSKIKYVGERLRDRFQKNKDMELRGIVKYIHVV